MPPRRSARVATAAEQRAWAFPQLPLLLAMHIFSLLPADQRLRAAEVSRGWRATVALPALWRRLDLSRTSGVVHRDLAALLDAAVARAGSALTALDVSGTRVSMDKLRDALRASGAVVEVRASTGPLKLVVLKELLDAEPQLRELHATVDCNLAEAVGVLESHPPLAPLHLQSLLIRVAHAAALPPALITALEDGRLHPCMKRLVLCVAEFHTPGALDAVANVFVARPRLCSLCLTYCALSPAAAPALARVLREGAITELKICCPELPFLDVASAAVLADALRACTTRTSLGLSDVPDQAAPVLTTLLSALEGHHCLASLDLNCTRLEHAPAVVTVLVALLAADAQALTKLNVWRCDMGEVGLGALLDVLPRNHHLRELDICENGMLPAGFMRARLLPAVRDNTSLRELTVGDGEFGDDDEAQDEFDALYEAERIIARRTAR